MTDASSAPVIIVGAGPVGLSLALALIRQGVRVAVYEALPTLSDEARASTFHPATLELFAQWGVIDTVLTNGQRVDQLQFWEREGRKLVATFDYSLIAHDTDYPFRLQCPQSVLTRLLLPIVAASPLAEVHMAHRLTGFADHGDHVRATFVTPMGVVTAVGSWLCGADGAKSTVRKALGVSFDGMTYEDRFLLVGSDLDLARYFPGAGPVCYLYDPDEWVITLRLPGLTRVVFRARPDEDDDTIMAAPQVRERIAAFLGAAPDFTILGVSMYNVHQRVCSRFRCGRVVLAGDAAHINNPVGGFGMNSGIHDAALLATTLGQVLAGAPAALLDAYSEARRTVALEHIQASTQRQYDDMTAQARTERAARNARMQHIAQSPELARDYLLKASMLA